MSAGADEDDGLRRPAPLWARSLPLCRKREQTFRCDVCGQRGEFAADWGWYGRGGKFYAGGAAITCSDACRAAWPDRRFDAFVKQKRAQARALRGYR